MPLISAKLFVVEIELFLEEYPELESLTFRDLLVESETLRTFLFGTLYTLEGSGRFCFFLGFSLKEGFSGFLLDFY